MRETVDYFRSMTLHSGTDERLSTWIVILGFSSQISTSTILCFLTLASTNVGRAQHGTCISIVCHECNSEDWGRSGGFHECPCLDVKSVNNQSDRHHRCCIIHSCKQLNLHVLEITYWERLAFALLYYWLCVLSSQIILHMRTIKPNTSTTEHQSTEYSVTAFLRLL